MTKNIRDKLREFYGFLTKTSKIVNITNTNFYHKKTLDSLVLFLILPCLPDNQY